MASVTRRLPDPPLPEPSEWVAVDSGRRDRTRYQLLAATISAANKMTMLITATCAFFMFNSSALAAAGWSAGTKAEPRASHRSNVIVASNRPPVKMPARVGGKSARRRPFCSTAMVKSPRSVP